MSTTFESISFVPFFEGQTRQMAAHAAEAERRYLEDTRWQDGPSNQNKPMDMDPGTSFSFDEIPPFDHDVSMADDDYLWLCDPFELEENLLKTMPLRGLKQAARKELLKEYATH